MKELHAVIRLDIEQKTEADGAYTVPIAWVEVQTYVTKWRSDKAKTFSILRQLMRDAKAPRTGYPKFGVVSAPLEAVAKFEAAGRPVQVSRVASTPSVPPAMPQPVQSAGVMGDQSVASTPPVYEPLGNWEEDFPHENGNYQNKCAGCGKYFIGHKRRVHCKVCVEVEHGT